MKDNWSKEPIKLKPVADQLISYFNKERTTFEVKLSPEGTAFQQQIWNQLSEIPYGQTRSYQDIALAINKPSACRAIGMANSKNPIPIIIPCHRVIGKNGKLTGYAGGLETKAKLLEIENIDLTPSKEQLQLF
ncbi:MAG: methylated-DNA--[protein]-cysteine S-methyltransferase [Labilibaculum sp.]|nr:methylated-DNA--[protein]-cysteine S-methyltransferase [Labilibaculum sp.]